MFRRKFASQREGLTPVYLDKTVFLLFNLTLMIGRIPGRSDFFSIIAALPLMFFLSAGIQATPLIYTFSGAGTGSFSGVPFTNAAITFTVYGDTTNIVDNEPGYGRVLKVAASYSTVSVNGVIGLMPVASQLSVFVTDIYGSPQDTALGLQGPNGDMLDFTEPSLYSYGLDVATNISGMANYNGSAFNVTTILGNLNISASGKFFNTSYSVVAGSAPAFSPWTLFQFSYRDPMITFETGSTAFPSINGVHLGPYGFGGDATFSTSCFGHQIYGNANGTGYLDIWFDQPKQSVGAWFSIGNGNGVIEVAYDKNNNIIDSNSVTFNTATMVAPPFISLSEATTNIYKVEWRYVSPTYFGVDNILYKPGPAMVLSNAPSTPGQFSFKFQTLPGHTNIVQMRTNLADSWINLTNATYLGMGEIRQITIPVTNSSSGFFRVQTTQ